MFQERSQDGELNIWPCFVDALSSLLIVIIFVIIGSFLSQTYLSTILNDTDSSLKNLQNEYENARQKIKKDVLMIQQLQRLLGISQKSEGDLKVQTASLSKQLEELNAELRKLNQDLAAERSLSKANEEKWASERENKEKNLQEQLDQIRKLQAELIKLKSEIPPSVLQNPELLRYRSEFFGVLQDILGGRSDIRTVGDRFVFQAEVLFAKGSAELGNSGKLALDTLANVLKELSKKIPSNIAWVLRVDGHTDRLPIHNDVFDSNWELSLARAACVVKYLISKGIPAKNLAAAGFAEYYPLTTDINQMAKNRRIELRFDHQ